MLENKLVMLPKIDYLSCFCFCLAYFFAFSNFALACSNGVFSFLIYSYLYLATSSNGFAPSGRVDFFPLSDLGFDYPIFIVLPYTGVALALANDIRLIPIRNMTKSFRTFILKYLSLN